MRPMVQPCCKDSVSTVESQFALLRMEVLQKFELLRSEVQDALAKLQVASIVPIPPEIQTGSVDEWFECCFGDFSPRAQDAMSSVLRTDVLRSEERRVGKECLRLCRSRWSPYH